VSEAKTDIPASIDDRAEYILARIDNGDEGGDGEAGRSTEVDENESGGGPEPADAFREPPMSWPEGDKASFRRLPPDLQAVVAQRESERERLVTQRTQEIAERERALEAERQRHVRELDALIGDAERSGYMTDLRATDWQRMSRENPAAFLQRSTEAQRHLDLLAMARQRRDALAAEDARATEQREAELLAQHIPEWRDPGQRGKLLQEMAEVLGEAGFSSAELPPLRDHRMVLLLRDAVRHRKAERTRQSVEAKKTAAGATRTQRPGPGGERGGGSRIDALRKKALAGGSIDDRANYILAVLDEDD